MACEIELKYLISATDLQHLPQLPFLQQFSHTPPQQQQLISLYYDTPDLTLARHKMTFRLRTMAGEWFQSIKGKGQALDGLHTRMEWEDKLNDAHADFSKLALHDLPDDVYTLLADPVLQQHLQPIFRTEVMRTDWRIEPDAHTCIEIALDLGHLIIEKTTPPLMEPICEIELELINGEVASLLDFATRLKQEIHLTEDNASKAQRGYALYARA